MGSAVRIPEKLPPGHPCEKCSVRGEALCSALDCGKLSEFKRLGSSLRLGAGQTLFREGDPAMRVFSLTRGSLKLFKILPGGRRQIVGFLYPGDFLGISVDKEHAFTAVLIQDCELCSFSRERFVNFLSQNPALEHQLYWMAAHELEVARQQLVVLGRKSPRGRLASFLLVLAQRAERLGNATDPTVELPMSRTDIADYLGLTKETVSRAFSGFRASRLIRLRTLRHVEILDRAALAQAAEG